MSKGMLSQLNHWIEIVSTAVDALLLLRVLQLKLHRVYLFITLSCVLTVFFDGLMLWFHADSREFERIFVYSRFLYAFVLPAAAYDVWEEVKAQIVRIRRFAIFRLVSSLILAAVLALIIVGFASNEEGSGYGFLATLAIIVWAASSTASLAFLWSVHRLARAQNTTLPGNTSVWLLFFQLSLAAEVFACFLIITNQQFNPFVNALLDISLGIYGILIALWCAWKLRAAHSVSATQDANLG
jgi:hypothetical protein